VKASSLLVWIGWLVLVAGGIALNRLSPFRPVAVEPFWVAARDLPANTHLSAEDLKKPEGLADTRNLTPLDGLVGKYLWEDRTAGSQVKPSDLHDRPQVPDAAVTFIYPLAQAEIGLAEVLAPGDLVSICMIGEADGDALCSGPLGVIVIHLENGMEERWLLLDVAGQEAELGRVLSAQHHFVLGLVQTEVDNPEPSGENK
jgi:hypothetical protein